jgi:hypothetical protein
MSMAKENRLSGESCSWKGKQGESFYGQDIDKYWWRLGGLLASRQSLAFDWKTSVEPRVDRPELPMELCQLKIDRRGYETEKE